MHAEITRSFKRYHLFGFTGTPIFAESSGTGGNPRLRTTSQAFGDKLHTYTIVDAINDKNVLPVRIDYINTNKAGAASRSEEHTSELQSLMRISYAVFCLKKTRKNQTTIRTSEDNHTQLQKDTK